MLKKPIVTILITFGTIISVFAQQKFTISGSIKDAKSGESIIGASVVNKEAPSVGTVSNDYGFYSLTLKEGNYKIAVAFLGFETQVLDVKLDKNQLINVSLNDQSTALDEVVIKSEKENKNVTSTEMSTVKLDVKDVAKVPVLFGEKDILKTIQLLPGIKSAGEGNSGFYVRGGGIDQNLILLDEATVYNASHLLGFFSVFNSDAIKDVNIIKGGMPAQYGGRLSSVLDIKMNDGNNQTYHASGGIGLISSRLTVEGPLQKDKSSFIVSGRRTYADVFLKLSKDTNTQNTTLYFYDLNLKTNYQIDAKNRIFLSGYFGRDKFGFSDLFGFEWGNTTATLRWNHIFSDKLFSNTSVVFSDYDYNLNISSGPTKFGIASSIRDWNLKQDFSYFLGNQTIKFGLNSIYHTFLPSNVTRAADATTGPQNTSIEKRFAWENAFYASDEFAISSKLKANIGLRLSTFSAIGAGTFFRYNTEGVAVDSTTYNSGEFVKTYVGFEPRFALNYTIDPANSIKFSLARTKQYVQLLSNSTATTPTDLWIPASNNVKPQTADQIALGYFKNFDDDKFEASVEIYYKNMDNQIDYKNGAQLQVNKNVEADLVFGRGWSYGAEFFLKKKYGKLNGWVGYTWSKTERQFDKINNGNVFAAKQDRTHDISVVGIYDLNKKWNISATWVYSTGNAVTFPSGKYYVNGRLVPYFTERNGYRMPDYHRLDVGVNYTAKKTKKLESSWNFSVYNLYNRKNAYQITFEENPDNKAQTQAVRTALFGIIPSATWNFKF